MAYVSGEAMALPDGIQVGERMDVGATSCPLDLSWLLRTQGLQV